MPLSSVNIIATDIDREILEKAKASIYTRFSESLDMDGMLFVESTEQIISS